MPNEMEYWEPIDDDAEWEDDGIEDVLSADLVGIAQQTKRSLDEILQLEIHLINTCTDIDPITWVHLYWEKFRKIMDENSSDTESQIKRRLYLNE